MPAALYDAAGILSYKIDVYIEGDNKKRMTVWSSSDNIYEILLEICKILLHIGSWSNQDLLEFLLTCTCRDRMSADDVLLKTLESVDAAADSCLAEHLGSLLE